MSELYGYTVPYEHFLKDVRPWAPDVPEFVAVHAIRNACIEFCEKTNYVQQNIVPISGQMNVATYQISTPDGTRFLDAIEMYYNENLLIPKSVDELAVIYRSYEWDTIGGNPAYVTRIIEPEIQLVPFPVSYLSNAITGRISLAPTRDSCEIEHRVWEHYAETIAHGALARLYAMPDQPYSNPKAAEEFRRRFVAECGSARRKVEKGLGRADVRMQFQGWV
ncbi:hypothetical protein [Paraburkholderia unamae]|uniref:Uncharacterized protein n=1 Tax=Paraburkholderia unamae TaxID=219649 RepID=A0ACC6RH63_9BURK